MVKYHLALPGSLDEKLAEEISGVVRESFLAANVGGTYTQQQSDAFLSLYRPELIRQWIPQTGGVLAFEGQKLIGNGFVMARQEHHEREDGGFLYGLYILPDSQGGGVGSSLLVYLLRVGNTIGLRNFKGKATMFPGVLDFYKKRGFGKGEEVSSRVGDVTIPFLEIHYKSSPWQYALNRILSSTITRCQSKKSSSSPRVASAPE
ncbi:GNAT family N-acetyltransferase [Candidatus Woesearchaeota archaeon]|nr:GNAT family N-acetyltransferase [Candidatus Woesearchaeota archaeon]